MKTPELERTFKSKFKLSPSAGKKHILYRKYYKGQRIYQIPVSRTHPDITDGIMGEMAKECFLPLGQFKKSVDCTHSKEKFDSLTLKGWKQKYGAI